MIQVKYILFYWFIISLFIFNCGGVEEESITGSVPTEFTGFYIENTADLNFIIKAQNVKDIKYCHFYVTYDTLRLSYISSNSIVKNTQFTLEAQEDENGVAFSYAFTSPLNGNSDIMNISFSGSNYEDTELRINQIYALTANNKTIDLVQGGGICYIDDGLLIQAYENRSEPMSAWEPTGNYIWDNALCGYIDLY